MSDKQNKKPNHEKSENAILNSPIRENSNPEIPSPFFTEDDVKEVQTIDKITKALHDNMAVYSIDDLLDVWCRGVTNGATLWQYCQDTNRPLPTSFEAGLIELINEIRSSPEKAKTLQDFINNNMLLLGVFDEKL